MSATYVYTEVEEEPFEVPMSVENTFNVVGGEGTFPSPVRNVTFDLDPNSSGSSEDSTSKDSMDDNPEEVTEDYNSSLNQESLLTNSGDIHSGDPSLLANLLALSRWDKGKCKGLTLDSCWEEQLDLEL